MDKDKRNYMGIEASQLVCVQKITGICCYDGYYDYRNLLLGG